MSEKVSQLFSVNEVVLHIRKMEPRSSASCRQFTGKAKDKPARRRRLWLHFALLLSTENNEEPTKMELFLGTRSHILKLELSVKTALTMAKAMKPTKLKTHIMTALARTRVAPLSCWEMRFW